MSPVDSQPTRQAEPGEEAEQAGAREADFAVIGRWAEPPPRGRVRWACRMILWTIGDRGLLLGHRQALRLAPVLRVVWLGDLLCGRKRSREITIRPFEAPSIVPDVRTAINSESWESLRLDQAGHHHRPHTS